MDPKTFITTVLLAITPISELRGAIPFAYFRGNSLLVSALIGGAFNLLVSPIAYLFLSYFHQFFYRVWPFYKKVFDKTVVRVRNRISVKIDKYGMLGIILFVGIPLPVTGAWSGTLGAWLLGLDRKHSLVAVSLGVVLATLIVTIVLLLGKGMFSIFIKIV
ncbi:MAG: small multi-drug export protein [Sphaerochaetaceae bacterium]